MQEKVLRIPYQGSKQAIIKKIYEIINKDLKNTRCLFSENKINTIYDLFTGGGSVGYYFYNQGWNVYMNDINKSLIELHQVLNTKNSPLTKELLYKWISREEFKELIKRDDWYGALIRYCWSFGNNQQGYLYGKDIEEYKKQLHFIIVNKDIEAGKKFLEMIGKQDDYTNFNKIFDIKEQKERRLFIRSYILKNTQNKPFGKHNDLYLYCDKNDYEVIKDFSIVQKAKWLNENKRKLIELQQLENLEQLQRLEQLEQKNINFSCKNYYDFDFQENSIIFCDPPYINTAGYNKETFDFDKFDNWIREMKKKNIKVYISEYTNHNNEWREVASINKMSLFSKSKATKTIKQEKIFCNI